MKKRRRIFGADLVPHRQETGNKRDDRNKIENRFLNNSWSVDAVSGSRINKSQTRVNSDAPKLVGVITLKRNLPKTRLECLRCLKLKRWTKNGSADTSDVWSSNARQK
jgi:hypothetical protein